MTGACKPRALTRVCKALCPTKNRLVTASRTIWGPRPALSGPVHAYPTCIQDHVPTKLERVHDPTAIDRPMHDTTAALCIALPNSVGLGIAFRVSPTQQIADTPRGQQAAAPEPPPPLAGSQPDARCCASMRWNACHASASLYARMQLPANRPARSIRSGPACPPPAAVRTIIRSQSSLCEHTTDIASMSVGPERDDDVRRTVRILYQCVFRTPCQS